MPEIASRHRTGAWSGRVIPGIGAEEEPCAGQRTKVKTPATTARNRKRYSSGLGPPAWRTATIGSVMRTAVILTLRSKQ